VAISPRTLSLIIDPVKLRRARVTYRADPELYAELREVAQILLAFRDDRASAITLDLAPESGDDGPMLSTQEAARYIGIKPDTVRLWIRTGKMRGIKKGRDWRIPLREVQKALAWCPVNSTSAMACNTCTPPRRKKAA
jgi:excisionase family DNA binding protein